MADSHSFDSSLRQEEGSEKTKRLDIFQKKDQPCDVTLVVKDGKQFRAHENVLSKASSFLEKMLDNNWKESREGVIQLDVLSGDTTEDISSELRHGPSIFLLKSEGGGPSLNALDIDK